MRLLSASTCLLPILSAAVCRAGEITLEARPFVIERALSTGALPTQSTALRVDAETLAAFEIKTIATHGCKVKAGEILVSFDTESIDRRLDDGRRALEAATLTLGQAEVELKGLKEGLALKLDAARRSARNAADDLAYFNSTSRRTKEQRAEESLKRYRQALEGEQEELRQLEKMYKADDLTEETEEIILKRQKDAVAAAEFAFHAEELDHRRTLGTEIPREAEELNAAAKSSALALARAETELSRQISLKEIEVATARIGLERQKDDFAKLSADRKLVEAIKAPADGWFYHGVIEDGKWSTGEAVKALVPSGQVQAKKAFATFIPASSPLVLTAFSDEATASSLPTDCQGFALAPGREELVIPVKVAKIAPTPGTDGRYRIDLTASWPADTQPVPGSSAQVRLISYENPKALSVPAAALRATRDGWAVTVKLADGKTGPRTVKRGRTSGDLVEILSGLEPGQVVIAP